jgi:hypothetical protein
VYRVDSNHHGKVAMPAKPRDQENPKPGTDCGATRDILAKAFAMGHLLDLPSGHAAQRNVIQRFLEARWE